MNLKLFVLTLALSLFLVGCESQSKIPTSDSGSSLEKVSIGYSALRISLPIFVAKEQGLFEKHGLNVNLKRYDTAQPLVQALAAGQIDMGGYSALPIQYNVMLRSGTDLVFTTAMLEDQQHRISYFVIPKDAPKDFSLVDLKGKKIGILPTIAYKAWATEILKQSGLMEDDYELIQIAPNLTPAALQSGQVDALFTNDPAATTTIENGIGRILSDVVEVPKSLGEPFLFGSFNFRKDYVQANSKIVNNVTKALNEAIAFVNENPTAAKDFMKPYLSEAQQPFVEAYPDALYAPSYEFGEVEFQAIADKYLNIGIIPESVDLSGLIMQ